MGWDPVGEFKSAVNKVDPTGVTSFMFTGDFGGIEDAYKGCVWI